MAYVMTRHHDRWNRPTFRALRPSMATALSVGLSQQRPMRTRRGRDLVTWPAWSVSTRRAA